MVIPDIGMHIRHVVGQYGRPRHRYRSWYHCYDAFGSSATSDSERLALHLAFYLASWGMYRGSSFLLQYDYTINFEVVSLLQEPSLFGLRGAPVSSLRKQTDLICDAADKIREAYVKQMHLLPDGNVDLRGVSDTLVTKILLGSIGCVPAFDRYLRQGAQAAHCKIWTFNKASLAQCFDFYLRNEIEFDRAGREAQRLGFTFPPMKLLDMYFWAVGIAEE